MFADHILNQTQGVAGELRQALAKEVELIWRNPGTGDHAWFPGKIIADETQSSPAMTVVSCADPRAETIEALRWARELLAGGVKPEEIAICASSPDLWDEHMLVLSRDAGLPVHFSHGTPALAGRDGQACAALADTLLNGLRQHRVRRLLRYASRAAAVGHIPQPDASRPDCLCLALCTRLAAACRRRRAAFGRRADVRRAGA